MVISFVGILPPNVAARPTTAANAPVTTMPCIESLPSGILGLILLTNLENLVHAPLAYVVAVGVLGMLDAET